LWREKIKKSNRFNFLPVDYVILIYNAILIVSILFFHNRISNWPLYLLFNASISGYILYVRRYLHNSGTTAGNILRRWYFPILLLLLYEETGGLVFMWFPGWLDNALAQFEFNLLGVHPTLFLQKFNYPVLNEYFMFCYLMYFVLLAGFPMILFFRKMYQELDRYVFALALTYCVCFLGFSLLPITGPFSLFKEIYDVPLKGVLFTPAVDYLIDSMCADGGGMPSSHTAAAVVILIYAWRFVRKIGYLITPVVIGLVIGTFWGRIHFVLDSLAGVVVAVTCIIIANIIYNRYLLVAKKVETDNLEVDLRTYVTMRNK